MHVQELVLKPDVQQIEKQEEDDEHDLSDNNSDISIYNYGDYEPSNHASDTTIFPNTTIIR
jgi:hypothetical protein